MIYTRLTKLETRLTMLHHTLTFNLTSYNFATPQAHNESVQSARSAGATPALAGHDATLPEIFLPRRGNLAEFAIRG